MCLLIMNQKGISVDHCNLLVAQEIMCNQTMLTQSGKSRSTQTHVTGFYVQLIHKVKRLFIVKE